MCNSHDRFAKVEAEALRLHDEFWLDTIRFFRHANEIIHRFDEWKDIERFYFIPLRLDMAYYIGGLTLRIAEPPIYLGTFTRNTLENQDLFSLNVLNAERLSFLSVTMALHFPVELISRVLVTVVGVVM